MTAKTLIFGFPAAVCILLSLFVGAAMGQWLANPVNPDAQRAVASLTKVDYISITHGHRDHVGDAVEIAKKTGAALIANPVFNPKAAANEADRAYGGNPAGFVISIRNGPVIYHSGDTAYFRDMETIGESYAIDVALRNIGGHFGMEPKMAARAAQSVRAKLAVPHHFGTFPGITPNSTEFAAELKQRRVAFREMKPGETITFQGNRIIQQ